MIVVSKAAEVIERNHLEVRARQCSRELLSNSLQNPRTCFLLDPDRKRKLPEELNAEKMKKAVWLKPAAVAQLEFPVRLVHAYATNVIDTPDSDHFGVVADSDSPVCQDPLGQVRRHLSKVRATH